VNSLLPNGSTTEKDHSPQADSGEQIGEVFAMKPIMHPLPNPGFMGSGDFLIPGFACRPVSVYTVGLNP
jgi:hypothetical protein